MRAPARLLLGLDAAVREVQNEGQRGIRLTGVLPQDRVRQRNVRHDPVAIVPRDRHRGQKLLVLDPEREFTMIEFGRIDVAEARGEAAGFVAHQGP